MKTRGKERFTPISLTLLIGFFVTVFWLWMFRLSFSGFHNLFYAWKYHGWLEGLGLWLISLNSGPWLVLACFVLPWPMVKDGRGVRIYGLLVASAIYLVFLMLCADLWHSNMNGLWEPGGWRMWLSWGAVVSHTITLLMPVSAIWIGGYALQGWNEFRYSFTVAHDTQKTFENIGWRLFTVTLAIINIGCVLAGVFASQWLRGKNLGPWLRGLAEVGILFVGPPQFVLRILADEVGRYVVLGWTVIVTFLAVWFVVRVHEWKRGMKVFLAAFSLSGYIALWAVGEAFLNGGY